MSTEFGGNSISPPTLPPPSVRPPTAPPKTPGLALVLSLFPGIGQVYNGQPAKALFFFAAWAGAIYMAIESGPLPFAFVIPFVYFYNLVDAYKSAAIVNARAAGGLVTAEDDAAESPVWGATLLGIGFLLLLNNLGWISLAAVQRYWPVLLIVAGAVFLRSSLRRETSSPATHPTTRIDASPEGGSGSSL